MDNMCYGYECKFFSIDEFGNDTCLSEENCKNYMITKKKKSIKFNFIEDLGEKFEYDR